METCPLTGRQLQILTLNAEGLNGPGIAGRLGISAGTVRTLRHVACKRLGASNVAQAIVACIRAGWIDAHLDSPYEAAQLFALEKLLARIAVALEQRHDDLTLVQRRYLDAFEEFLYAKPGQARRVSQDRLSVAFERLTREAGIRIDHERVQHPQAA